MTQQNDKHQQTDTAKAPYEKPELIKEGDVQSLTQGGFSTGSDAETTGEFGGPGPS